MLQGGPRTPSHYISGDQAYCRQALTYSVLGEEGGDANPLFLTFPLNDYPDCPVIQMNVLDIPEHLGSSPSLTGLSLPTHKKHCSFAEVGSHPCLMCVFVPQGGWSHGDHANSCCFSTHPLWVAASRLAGGFSDNGEWLTSSPFTLSSLLPLLGRGCWFSFIAHFTRAEAAQLQW